MCTTIRNRFSSLRHPFANVGHKENTLETGTLSHRTPFEFRHVSKCHKHVSNSARCTPLAATKPCVRLRRHFHLAFIICMTWTALNKFSLKTISSFTTVFSRSTISERG
ncbi:hypothetical protein Hypma_001283 [Hypsizygus marmoreus]|uniref:Uncharacterized protein n=1 Tax=Hypsizygus marmoreus TaxID=39966 RepID=A0A369JA33_HYPMA|nr:hypothetical protein Hypma_001283 [Hypsizygus marmoreus]